MKNTPANHALGDAGEFQKELDYLRRCTERDAGKILSLDIQSLALRHELEQRRRGFSLLAELAVTLGQDSADYDSIFISVSRRINSALNMQRTAVLIPDREGWFTVAVLQGYPEDEEKRVASRRLLVDPVFLDPVQPVLITSADPEEAFRDFRSALALPYFISAPVVLHNEVAAILVTGRMLEQNPYLPRLGKNDAETVLAVRAYLAAMLTGKRLVEAEARTQIMLDATPLCCNFWDEQGNNVDCNQEAVRFFGLSSKQEYLQRYDELSPKVQPNGGNSPKMSRQKIREAFAEGYAKFEWMHQKPDGEAIPTEITLVRVKRGSGYIVAGYTRDLREEKAMLAEMRQTEDELRQARDLAEQSARAKSDFLANMSHEIRTPMNAILGMTHILAESELTEKQRAFVEQAQHSANLLLHIINDILDFSKIEAGRMKMEHIEFSLRGLIRNVHNIIRGQVSLKSVRLRTGIAPEAPDLLWGDPLRLEQILINLANNAVKFTHEGRVGIRVCLDDSRECTTPGTISLLFEVYDTGIGMSKEQVAKIFTPFAQADTSTTRKYGGTGLGLAISGSLVRLMNGEIWCQSRLGHGSSFFFTAIFAKTPEEATDLAAETAEEAVHTCEQPPADADEQSKGDDSYKDLAGMYVLLAEDNEINQMIALELLTAKGLRVRAVATGLEAIQALEEEEYDLVLMDIQMPEMDGLKATGTIRSNPRYRTLPIIAMTAHAMEGDREVSLASGMNDHITKPIEPMLLFATLRRWDRRKKKECKENDS